MKKKVRIYKAPDGQGQYINKTAKFLRKAAMGGMVDPNAYYNDLIKTAYIQIKSKKALKDVYDSFIGQQMPDEKVKELLSEVYSIMIQNGEIDPQSVKRQFDDLESEIENEQTRTNQFKQETGQENLAQEGADENAAANQAADDDAEQMNQYEQQSMDIAMQPGDEQEFADETDDRSYLGYKYGGPMFMAEGGESEDDSDYSQAIMNQYENQESVNDDQEEYTGDIDSLIQEAPGMQNITFPGVEDYLYNYQPISGDESINYLQPYTEPESTEPEYRHGGAHSKKSFVKNVMSMLKKAEGGQGDQIEHTPQASQMDDLKGSVKDKKSNFIQSVKSSANEAKINEWFDQMKKTGDPMLQDVMNKVTGQKAPSNQPAPTDQPQARRGMAITPRDYRKIYKSIMRAQRAMGRPGSSYDAKVRMPYSGFAGFYDMYAGMPNPGAISYPDMMRYYTQLQTPVVHSKDLMPNIEVYDTDIFGRPKRYALGLGYRKSAEDQAMESELINNAKGVVYLPSDRYGDEDNERLPEEYIEDEYIPPYSDREAVEEGLIPGMQFGGSLTADTDTLAKFMYGQAMDPQMAKNVNDPYDEDLTESDLPEARRGRVARGLRNVLVPWNPVFGYAGSWKQQQNLPFYAGTNNPYLGSLQGARPVATQVTKTSMIGRRPKEWTEYYQTPGSIGTFNAGTMYKGSDGQMHYHNANAGMIENQMENIRQKQDTGYNTDTSGMSGAARRAVRQGEREMQRNQRKVARNPEGNVPFIAGQFNKDNVGLGTRMKMFGAKLSGANQKREGGIPQYNPGGPTLLGTKPAFDQFKSQCPPGSMKDPQSGLCKNFAGEVVPSNQAATAATTFQQNTQGIGTNNPMAYSGTNNLTGQEGMHFNADGTAYENKGVKDLSKEKDKQPELVGAQFKAKKMKNFDGEVFNNVLNMGIKGAAGFINRGQQNAIERQMYDEYTSDNLFGKQVDKHRGDWVDLGSQLGQFRFDQQGQDRSGFSSYGKYGGQFAKGGSKGCPQGQVMVNGRCVDVKDVASRNDSLAIYKNSLEQQAYYDKLKPYYDPKQAARQMHFDMDWMNERKNLEEQHANDLQIKQTQKDILEYKPTKFGPGAWSKEEQAKFKQLQNLVRTNKDKDISYLTDMITGMLDPNAPALRYDRRIRPQGMKTYSPYHAADNLSKKDKQIIDKSNNLVFKGKLNYITGDSRSIENWVNWGKKNGFSKNEILGYLSKLRREHEVTEKLKGYETMIPYYDPVAVKPGDMLTDDEVRRRFKKYGRQGIPEAKLKRLGLLEPDKKESVKPKPETKKDSKPTVKEKVEIKPLPKDTIQVGEKEVISIDDKTGEVKKVIEPIYEERPVIDRLPIKPIVLDKPKDELELMEYEENLPPEYPVPFKGMDWHDDYKRRINWEHSGLTYRLPTFRKPGHSGSLLKWGDTRYINLPTIEKYNEAYLAPRDPYTLQDKLIRKFSGYDEAEMEGYQGGDAYYPGEIERAQEEGRRIEFKGFRNKADKALQEEYNRAYDEYERKKALEKYYSSVYMNPAFLLKQEGGEPNMNDDVMINEPYPYYPESEDVEEPFQVAKKGGEKVTYMSEKQIREFLAAGGELEYL